MNTVIIDDSVEKVIRHPNNIIAVPEYNHSLHQSGEDTALAVTAAYLEELRKCSNVSAYIAQNKVQFAAAAAVQSQAAVVKSSAAVEPTSVEPITAAGGQVTDEVGGQPEPPARALTDDAVADLTRALAQTVTTSSPVPAPAPAPVFTPTPVPVNNPRPVGWQEQYKQHLRERQERQERPEREEQEKKQERLERTQAWIEATAHDRDQLPTQEKSNTDTDYGDRGRPRGV